ncbi:MAG TPA: hypothetical protein VIW23_16475 [Candidatus Acidoferrum sp.]|jgi:polyisoprenoid-binding protein YceI
MKNLGVWPFGRGLLAIFALAILLSAAAAPPRQQLTVTPASEIMLNLDPAQSKVHFEVDSTVHTVHGTFNFKSGAVRFNSETGKASGEIVVSPTAATAEMIRAMLCWSRSNIPR